MSFFWVIASYVLGSIPFGYLIGLLSGKNVLQLGWRKTSGSNVFKNVGKWQGIATGLLDVAKGYLAVYIAQKLGLPLEIQALSGVAAVTGHNWSVFLKFSGGRGIGTFAGAFLALAPQMLLVSIIPLIVFAIIWNASIGTLLFLATAIFLSIFPTQFLAGVQVQIGGLMTIWSLAPILIKRLSPIGEIGKSENKFLLIRNRLLFDDNQSRWDFRIKRIILKEKNNPGPLTKIIKPIALPLLVPPKIGWEVAKFGVKMAKKPIDFIFKNSEKVVTEIYPEDFKKMMIAAEKKVVLHQEEINRINVFPVADKDTGYNLAATLLGVEGTISRKNYSDFQELVKDIKEAAMINARGNAGMIYTGYLIEVLDRIKHLQTVDAFHLSYALQKGIKAARSSVIEPVEGTILDVIRTAGEKSFEAAKIKKEKNIIKVLEEALKFSEISLKETKEKLEVLKQNDVVDAGALGFVKILEAWVDSLKGVVSVKGPEITESVLEPEILGQLKYKYEVISSFRRQEEATVEKIREELSSLGDSLEIIEMEDKVKFHIHTNEPDAVTEKIKNFPEAEFKVEDMEKQMAGRIEKKPLGLVVDEVADLPEEFLKRYDIEVVPFKTKFPDGETIVSKEEIYHKMKDALKQGKPLPTTSAPSFKEFLLAYQKALEKFEKILVITVSSKLSGTYSSARIARSIFKKPTKLNIYVFDCFTAEAGEGLAAMKSQELISQGKTLEEIVEELKIFCPKIHLIACVPDFRYVVKGGRVKLPKILVGPVSLMQKMGIQLLVELKNGKIRFSGISFGKNIAKILAQEINKQRKGKDIKIAIAHADSEKEAKELKEELEKKGKTEVLFTSFVSPVVGTHTGPGALIAAFYPVAVDN